MRLRLQRAHKSADESGLLLSILPADRVRISGGLYSKDSTLSTPRLLSLFPLYHSSSQLPFMGSAHRCVIFLYNRFGQFYNIMVFSSVICHFEVKSKFKPESRTYDTELGKHSLNTLCCRVTSKPWPVFAHRIPIQGRRDIRLQLTHKSADESGFVAFLFSRQGAHQGGPL